MENDIIIALDSTDLKIANRGDWIHHKQNTRKGYLKIHVAVDMHMMLVLRNFRYLDYNGIKVAIKIRKNSSDRSIVAIQGRQPYLNI